MKSAISHKLIDINITKENFNSFIDGDLNITESDRFDFRAKKIEDGVFLFAVKQFHNLFQNNQLIIEFEAEYIFHISENPIGPNSLIQNACIMITLLARHYTIAILAIDGKRHYGKIAPVSHLPIDKTKELEQKVSEFVNTFNTGSH